MANRLNFGNKTIGDPFTYNMFNGIQDAINLLGQQVDGILASIASATVNVVGVDTPTVQGAPSSSAYNTDFINSVRASIAAQVNDLSSVVTTLSQNLRAKVVAQTESSVSVNPNVLNVWGEMASLTVSFTAGAAGYANEYMIQFTCPPSAATELSLPASVRWANGDVLEPEAGYTYQISIVDNLAVYAGWEADTSNNSVAAEEVQ